MNNDNNIVANEYNYTEQDIYDIEMYAGTLCGIWCSDSGKVCGLGC